VYEHAAAAIQSVLYEPVARRKVLDQILIVDVIHLDHMMLIPLEQDFLERQPQDGKHMRDLGRLQCFFAA
jgi:hypothetical protein